MTETITIVDWQRIPYQVDADVSKGVAIHPEPNGNGWAVTHVLSGVAFQFCPSESSAEALRERLLYISINGVGVGQMQICELCAIAPIVAAAVGESTTLERVGAIAEIMCEVLP